MQLVARTVQQVEDFLFGQRAVGGAQLAVGLQQLQLHVDVQRQLVHALRPQEGLQVGRGNLRCDGRVRHEGTNLHAETNPIRDIKVVYLARCKQRFLREEVHIGAQKFCHCIILSP